MFRSYLFLLILFHLYDDHFLRNNEIFILDKTGFMFSLLPLYNAHFHTNNNIIDLDETLYNIYFSYDYNAHFSSSIMSGEKLSSVIIILV